MRDTYKVKVKVSKDFNEHLRLSFISSTICLIVAIIIICVNRDLYVLFYASISAAAFGYLGILLFYLLNRTFDIFSEEGIKRVYKKEVLFEIKWDDVLDVSYGRCFLYVPIMCHWLDISLKEPILIKEKPKDEGRWSADLNVNVIKLKMHFIDGLIPEDIHRFYYVRGFD